MALLEQRESLKACQLTTRDLVLEFDLRQPDVTGDPQGIELADRRKPVAEL